MVNKILLFFFLTLFSINIYGQRDLRSLNELPETKEIRAPEFNTVTKYNISVDSLYRRIYIQDIRKSNDGKLHFYQWLYELPLENLKFEIQITDDNEISIVISSPTLGSNFISYWFQENKISSVLNRNVIKLGNWENTNENLEIIKECTRKLSDYFSTFITSQENSNDSEPGTFKYIANNVTKVNAKMDDNKEIGTYLFEPFFDENNRPKSTQLLNSLKRESKKTTLITMHHLWF
ncbi:hypothetical protein [Snuella sedimenti]|uniref:Uncharacterized protein n=1 Tax=Snuella sedimenti TaxID=2798802 RepID=A0A8J7J039_9FLAO|nr:hypothetical protein [Snuella sedimenti]MBJ6367042.1 hypothetical protein [Snuella sedimenti]